jgi:hypothetical protein
MGDGIGVRDGREVGGAKVSLGKGGMGWDGMG